ncbi:hypothetical protein CEXT_566981 [Caerostris extrusa]|uniref:Uncharacterized protein n=1 Tax=Caerostris extrusa TaxID=172846 RepID=A0AAV4SKC4_CAEEX|nr:hypothetical protein CEXT_566981 [Caerostris extrusa]
MTQHNDLQLKIIRHSQISDTKQLFAEAKGKLFDEKNIKTPNLYTCNSRMCFMLTGDDRTSCISMFVTLRNKNGWDDRGHVFAVVNKYWGQDRFADIIKDFAIIMRAENPANSILLRLRRGPHLSSKQDLYSQYARNSRLNCQPIDRFGRVDVDGRYMGPYCCAAPIGITNNAERNPWELVSLQQRLSRKSNMLFRTGIFSESNEPSPKTRSAILNEKHRFCPFCPSEYNES